MYFCCGVSVGDERAVCEAHAGGRFVLGIYGVCQDCVKLSDSDCDYIYKRGAEGVQDKQEYVGFLCASGAGVSGAL